MGGWWGNPNGESEAPEEARLDSVFQQREGIQRYPKRRVFKSRYGHRIELGDDEGELEIRITTPLGNSFVLRDSPRYFVEGEAVGTAGITLEDSKGNYMQFDTENNLFSIYFKGKKIETIEGDVILNVRKNEDGTGGDYIVDVEGNYLEKTR